MRVEDGMSAPVNIQLHRVSPTALHVSWDHPQSYQQQQLVTGYRVYYHVTATRLRDPLDVGDTRWEVKDVRGLQRVAELADLKPDAHYTVRVRSRGVDGRLGNFSEPAELQPKQHVDDDDDDRAQGRPHTMLYA